MLLRERTPRGVKLDAMQKIGSVIGANIVPAIDRVFFLRPLCSYLGPMPGRDEKNVEPWRIDFAACS